jgi:hypothetical protein
MRDSGTVRAWWRKDAGLGDLQVAVEEFTLGRATNPQGVDPVGEAEQAGGRAAPAARDVVAEDVRRIRTAGPSSGRTHSVDLVPGAGHGRSRRVGRSAQPWSVADAGPVRSRGATNRDQTRDSAPGGKPFRNCHGGSPRIHPWGGVAPPFEEDRNHRGEGLVVHRIDEGEPSLARGGRRRSPIEEEATVPGPDARRGVRPRSINRRPCRARRPETSCR